MRIWQIEFASSVSALDLIVILKLTDVFVLPLLFCVLCQTQHVRPASPQVLSRIWPLEWCKVSRGLARVGFDWLGSLKQSVKKSARSEALEQQSSKNPVKRLSLEDSRKDMMKVLCVFDVSLES